MLAKAAPSLPPSSDYFYHYKGFFQTLNHTHTTITLSLSNMTPPSCSSATTGKPLNPAAESWISKESTVDTPAGEIVQPLLPHQFFHSPPPPPPPYAAPMSPTYPHFYDYPSAHGGKFFYSHIGYFSFTYPHYQNTLPQYVGHVKQQMGKKVGAPLRRDGGCGFAAGETKINMFRQTAPPRLLKGDKIKVGVRSSRNNTCNLKWKPKSDFSGEMSGINGDKVNQSVVSSSSPSSGKNTTVMIRNIPNKLRRHSLMSFLDGYCKDHSLQYDFIYLPIDFKRLDNLGYAFVNFTTASAAVLIMELLNNFKWGGVNPTGRNKAYHQSKKICEVTWAKIQGKKELIRHFEESTFACHTVEFLPAEFDPPRNGNQSVDTKPKCVGKLKPIGPNYPNHLVVGRRRSP